YFSLGTEQRDDEVLDRMDLWGSDSPDRGSEQRIGATRRRIRRWRARITEVNRGLEDWSDVTADRTVDSACPSCLREPIGWWIARIGWIRPEPPQDPSAPFEKNYMGYAADFRYEWAIATAILDYLTFGSTQCETVIVVFE
ncbi:hypothetical protein LINGRAHAP2_LOCUS20103, partial [Linum grandiflorum]